MATAKRRSLITVSTSLLPPEWLASALGTVTGAAERLEEALKAGRPVAARLNAPFSLRDAEIEQLKLLAGEVRANAELLLVVSGGGTHLNARALLEGLRPPLDDGYPVLFLGHQLDSGYLAELMAQLSGKRVCLLLVGQGPMSAEAVAAASLLRDWVLQRYGQAEACRRIMVVADGDCFDLIQLAGQEGYRLQAMPPGLGGRFAAFTPASLLPVAVAGYDISQVVEGARSQARAMEARTLEDNPALAYAAIRAAAASQGRTMEMLWTEGPRWSGLGELWRYLMAVNGALFPQVVNLHSGAYQLEAWLRSHRQLCLDTALSLETVRGDVTLPGVAGWPSGQAVEGLKVTELIPQVARQVVTRQAPSGHVEVLLPRLDGFHLGALVAFFQRAAVLGELSADSPAYDELPLHVSPQSLTRSAAK